jgi:cyclopropane-fatty-acyl-phospholipid synthase
MSGTDATMNDMMVAVPPRDRWSRVALKLASMIRCGHLTVVLPDGSTHRIDAPHDGPEATIVLKDRQAIKKLVMGGNVGLAEAYIDGLWESPDLRAVMALAAANEAEWEAALAGSPWMRIVNTVLHKLRPNTRKGAKRNIVEHYDLGNEFYAQWLDPTMTYSSALFSHPEQTLKEGQLAKIHRLCQAIELKPGMTLLEIGCGWGAFAEVAARDYGARVTGVTLSPSQLAYGQARIAAAGLQDQVELRLQDYRDVSEQYDRIASIEMFEAVGEKFWPVYFNTLRERLLPGGLVGLQTITIEDRLFPTYQRSADFIQRHVFPGGMLPSPKRLREEVARAGLAWQGEHWFGQDYAETLARWNESFQSVWPRISGATRLSRMPADLRFKRLWEYYLLYCETGFRAGWTDVGQILLAKTA